MYNTRLLILIFGALLAVFLIGALINGFFQLVFQLESLLGRFLPWELIPWVLFLSTCFLIAVAYQVGLPWCKAFLNRSKKQSRSHPQPSAPSNNREAVTQSLESIDKLLERLQDDVAKEGIKQERERVSKEIARGDLILVVFGTGSSGKTSLIRALLNEVVGEVGAPMGSTMDSKVYRLRLKGFERGIQIIDTPGILEAGMDGRTREKKARQTASRADLMLVVLDSDLRAGELEVVNELSGLGKRLLLVLNKCDLRGEEENQRLLSLLKSRCKSLVKPKDVLAVTASPQSIPRIGKRPLQPPPELGAFLKRLATVLHSEGEELLANNILLQCRNLGNSGRILLDKQRQVEARQCIDRYSWVSAGVVTATPLPGVDLLGIAAVNAQMVMEIARTYGVELTKNRAQELAVSVGRTLTGLGVVKGGLTLITSALSLNLSTVLLGRAIQGVAAAWLTRVAGSSFITYFQQDQDWGDGGMQEVVQHHYDLNRRDSSLKSFLKTALRKVVEPLQKNEYRQLPPRPRPQEGGAASDHEHPEA